jgi:hypothetical protein
VVDGAFHQVLNLGAVGHVALDEHRGSAVPFDRVDGGRVEIVLKPAR